MNFSQHHLTAVPVRQAEAPAWRQVWPALALVALLTAAAIVGLSIYVVRDRLQDDWAVLDSVADLKVQQLSSWLEERRKSASLHATSFPQAELYSRWRDQDDAGARDLLLQRLGQFAEAGRFAAVTLLDEGGQTVWRQDDAPSQVPPAVMAEWLAVAAAGLSRHVGPYRDAQGVVWLDFISTLPVSEHTGQPIVVLHTRLEDYFPRHLSEFPLSGTSAEVVLFRRDGSDVLMLGTLQHAEDAPLAVRIPLNDESILAAQLASRSTDDLTRLKGTDYRGASVLGVGRRLPGTDWYLLVKIDFQEALLASLWRVAWITLLGTLVFLVIATLLVITRQRHQLESARAIERAQAEQLIALELLGAVADHSTDCIYVKDIEGRYLLFNRASAEFTGKPANEVLGRDDAYLFPKDQAEMLLAIHRRVLDENRTITTREVVDSTDGQRTVLATKGPLRDAEGHVIGVYGIARDVTEQDRAAASLEQRSRELMVRNEELQRFNRAMVGRELDMMRLKQEVNDLSRRLGIDPPYGREMVHPSDRGEAGPAQINPGAKPDGGAEA